MTLLINSHRFALPGWVPTDESGLGVWLRGDALTLNEGDPVQSWTDSGPNNAPPIQNTAASQPTFRTNLLNGKPGVRFDGVDDFLRRDPSPALAYTAAEIFAVVKIANDPPSVLSKCGLWYWNSSTDNTLFPFTNGTIEESFGSTSRHTVGNPTPSLAAWRLYNVVSTATEYTVTLDGTQIYTSAVNVVTMDSPSDAYFIGNNSSTVRLDGDICEIILYDHKLTATPRANLKTYITNKYGLVLA